jgi:hypothetical protein
MEIILDRRFLILQHLVSHVGYVQRRTHISTTRSGPYPDEQKAAHAQLDSQACDPQKPVGSSWRDCTEFRKPFPNSVHFNASASFKAIIKPYNRNA